MTRALSNMCLIIQSLLFLKNNDSGDKINEVYKVNIWKNKDIVKETKKYGYQGAFFILVYKNRKLCINSNETDKIKIKMELKQEITQAMRSQVDISLPHLVILNEDPKLSHKLRYQLSDLSVYVERKHNNPTP